MKTYIEVHDKDGNVVRRIDVSGKSISSIDRCEEGINRNINHEDYYTIQRKTPKSLLEI